MFYNGDMEQLLFLVLPFAYTGLVLAFVAVTLRFEVLSRLFFKTNSSREHAIYVGVALTWPLALLLLPFAWVWRRVTTEDDVGLPESKAPQLTMVYDPLAIDEGGWVPVRKEVPTEADQND